MSKKKLELDLTPKEWRSLPRHIRAEVLFYLGGDRHVQEIQATYDALRVTLDKVASDRIPTQMESILRGAVARLVAHMKSEEDILREIAAHCCGDNSCQYWPAGLSHGMATNGGCRCFDRGNASAAEVRVQLLGLITGYKKLYHTRGAAYAGQMLTL